MPTAFVNNAKRNIDSGRTICHKILRSRLLFIKPIRIFFEITWIYKRINNRSYILTSYKHKEIVTRRDDTQYPWWRHQMETFSTLLVICMGNSPVTSEFSSQRPVTRKFDVFFDLRLRKRLCKLSRRRWFEMPSRSLWRHCNERKNPCPAISTFSNGAVIYTIQFRPQNNSNTDSRLDFI